MKRKYIILIICLTIIMLANIKPTHYVFALFLDENYYRYSNADGGLTYTEMVFKSRDFALLKRIQNSCKDKIKGDKLYRLFWKNPICFWRWYSYFTDERYKLPYKKWKEIKQYRQQYKVRVCHQDF